MEHCLKLNNVVLLVPNEEEDKHNDPQSCAVKVAVIVPAGAQVVRRETKSRAYLIVPFLLF
jgi:hypothetical protein